MTTLVLRVLYISCFFIEEAGKAGEKASKKGRKGQEKGREG